MRFPALSLALVILLVLVVAIVGGVGIPLCLGTSTLRPYIEVESGHCCCFSCNIWLHQLTRFPLINFLAYNQADKEPAPDPNNETTSRNTSHTGVGKTFP
jgi:hypothetical protein